MWHFGNLLLRPKLCVWVCYRRGRKVTSSIIVVWGLRVAEQLSLSSHPTHRWSFYWEGCCFEQTYNGFSRWDQTVPDPSTGFDHFPPHFNSLNSLNCIKMKTLHNDNYMLLWYYGGGQHHCASHWTDESVSIVIFQCSSVWMNLHRRNA